MHSQKEDTLRIEKIRARGRSFGEAKMKNLQCYCSPILFPTKLAVVLQLIFIAFGASLHQLSAYNLSRRVPAVFAFGDSIADTGNTNYLTTIAKCNFPPYGRDFPGGKPTGRYSNGKVPTDLVAEKLGIKEFLPPYLNRSLEIDDLLTGVNFATGGTGYDPLSAQDANVYSLLDQLELFKEYKTKLKAAVGESRTSNLIKQSPFLVFAGSNDITNTYFLLSSRKLRYNVSQYTDLLVSYASKFYQAMYKEGARIIGILNVPPVGCLPSQRTLAGGPQRSCVDEYNRAATLFNSKLNAEVESLNTKLHGVTILVFDVYQPLLDLINNPSQTGFQVVNKGCCGTGNIEVLFLCTKFDDPLTCKDDSKYIFWDSFHPTEAAYRAIFEHIALDGLDISSEI
ncbi:hypothetical protein Dimus_017398 [Dionaea muscipula]